MIEKGYDLAGANIRGFLQFARVFKRVQPRLLPVLVDKLKYARVVVVIDAVKITVGAAVGAAVREGTGFAVWMGKAVGCGVKGASGASEGIKGRDAVGAEAISLGVTAAS